MESINKIHQNVIFKRINGVSLPVAEKELDVPRAPDKNINCIKAKESKPIESSKGSIPSAEYKTC